ncbi:MAG: ferredoxin [Desulfurellaceae bacterium]|nr:ferredoxin [Desulfurellaceae bacterium]
MKINLNAYACQGHARCYALAPELFDLNDEDLAGLLIDGDIPAELEEKARLAAQRCPEFAIEIIEE